MSYKITISNKDDLFKPNFILLYHSSYFNNKNILKHIYNLYASLYAELLTSKSDQTISISPDLTDVLTITKNSFYIMASHCDPMIEDINNIAEENNTQLRLIALRGTMPKYKTKDMTELFDPHNIPLYKNYSLRCRLANALNNQSTKPLAIVIGSKCNNKSQGIDDMIKMLQSLQIPTFEYDYEQNSHTVHGTNGSRDMFELLKSRSLL